MNGVPIAVVADQLGHKDTRITERHYAHLCRSYKRDIIRTNLPSFGFVDAPRDTERAYDHGPRIRRHHLRTLPRASKSARQAVK
jgi:hypothetical protein